jgi:very-short-patch-repair endonuclease
MEKNVEQFANECAKKLGDSQAYGLTSELEMFEKEGYGMWGKGIKSPIEQILFSALLYAIKINELQMVDPTSIDRFVVVSGIDIEPQFKIGKYRMDFKIEKAEYIFDEIKRCTIAATSKSILVECDSQEWHERTEKERRYEKARDRYFAKLNLKIFHYTGKEIINKPYEIAGEILKEVIGYDCMAT